jgi:two-component system alkaline phosphatase synthesis response regulator PhoP
VASAVDGEQALAAGRERRADLILLDLMLPGMSGLEVLRTLRREGVDTPVIVLSAKGEEVDRVVGLKVGADDYVPKPFSRPELLARVEAVLRRQGREGATAPGVDGEVLTSGTIRVDVGRREVTAGDHELDVTTREFDLLAFLVAHPGQIFSRQQLLAQVWGYDYDGTDRTVDVHVSWLRTKLRAIDGHDYFRTVRGVGYAFRPQAG